MHQGRKSVGHPVDVATGTLYSTHEDIAIPGKVQLTWERRYSTSLINEPSTPLGLGWTIRYFSTLTNVDHQFKFVTPEGDTEIFDDSERTIDQGGIVRNLDSFQELTKIGNRYIVTRWDVDTGEIERYVFEKNKEGAAWPLASVEDVSGQGLDLIHDKDGRLISVQQRLEKRTLLIDYTDSNRINTVKFIFPDNKQQVLVRYEYDQEGRLIAAFNALGNADRYEYDYSSRMTKEIVKDNDVFFFKYDNQGRCVKTTGLNNYDEKTFHFMEHIGWTEVTNSLDQTFRYQWLPSGQIVTEIDPSGGTKKTEYDEFGRITAKIDPNNNAIRCEYDEQGNCFKTIDALGQTKLNVYNDFHQPVSYTNTAGISWHRIYNQKNLLIETTDPDGARYRINYDENGNLIEIIDPLGNRLRQHFTPLGVLYAVTDWNGDITQYSGDAFGRATKRIDPLHNETFYHYDDDNNLVRIDYPDDVHYEYGYDASRNLISVTDPSGHTTRYNFGPCGRLLERIDPIGRKTNFVWGSEPEHLEAVVNPKGETYSFEYSAIGRVIAETGYDDRILSYEYDLAGNRTATINGLGKRIEYRRDALGRLINQKLPNGDQATFKYDPAGYLHEAINNDSQIIFNRDSQGHIVSEKQNSYTIERRYDLAGNLQQLQSNFGLTIDYQYDANGLMTQFKINGNDPTKFERDACGSTTSRIMPGNHKLNQQFDARGRLTDQSLSISNGYTEFETPRTLIQRSYKYEHAQLIEIQDQIQGKTVFVYDPAERLISAQREKGVSENFIFDDNDNITHFDRGDITTTYKIESGDRLTHKDNIIFKYDEQGRLVEKREELLDGNVAIWEYEWDAFDQLLSVSKPDGDIWKYKYDPFGRRLEKIAPDGQSFGFIWNEDVVLHELKDSSVTSSWVFDPDSFIPLSKIEEEEIYSIICDHLGTPYEMIDRDGRVVWKIDYWAWGDIRKQKTGGIDCPVRFQGQWHDKETGLHYNRFRYYDPETGRYISQDPIRLTGGFNLYAYVLDPISFFDPFGLVKAPASLPDEPGIYIITNGNDSYVGSAGIGKQGMNGRTSSTKHANAQRLLKMDGTKVQYVKVNMGTATSASDRNNILRHYENREYQKQTSKGFNMLNDANIQASNKVQSTLDLIDEHEVTASSRRSTCKGD